MKFNRLVLIALSLTVMMLALIGCGKDTARDGQKKLQVVATTTMLTDLVKEIGGDDVSVQGLMGPGVDPHLYQASAGDVTTMSKADVVVYNGVHLEGKMGSIFDNLAKQNKATIRVSDAIDPATLLDFEEDGVSTKDPHIWFDVANWKLAAKAVYEGLSKADPAHKENFQKRYESYLTKLDEADAYIKTQAESIPKESRVLVTAHDAFQYFARAYGFEVKGLQGVSTATEAGTQDMNELVQFIVDHKIKAIFVESSVPHKTIEAVQEACKAKGWDVSIGGELYSDSLGSEGTEGGTYIGMVKANIDTIAKALK
ncbi:manganese transporter [Veillonella denticariosi JCM 15641]|uniref:Manganese transporter n=1 Tax=Veillonella denticariosi JCM 15641 TaxID=1298594 RepID=A0A2S7ZCM9_9FIRM|nr:zinc ABC transporter substrate-binding protein [Veillonella denticariosi]PQL20979.1 manganese transporter [Veillonella denticariosi JCM 15641]